MRKAAMCLLAALCLWGATSWQYQPQWRVGQSVVLRNQTSQIPSTVLFTPEKLGLYRVSPYIEANGPGSGNWTLTWKWFDVSGIMLSSGIEADFDNGTNVSSMAPSPFSFNVAPFSYSITGIGGTYNVAFTIEQLQ